MVRKRYTAAEIICYRRTMEIDAGKRLGTADAERQFETEFLDLGVDASASTCG